MSAKGAYFKPVHLPSLPPELWMQILREATAVSDPLQPPLRTEWPRKTRTKADKRWKQAIVTKRYIARVCRAWYRFGIGFLYEHLVVSLGHHPAMLLRSATTVPVVEERSGAALGTYTKRLDINFDSFSKSTRFDQDDIHKFVKELKFLLPAFPHLTTLLVMATNCHHYRETSKIFDIPEFFLNKAPTTLQYLAYSGTKEEPISYSMVAKFLDGHPNLCSIGFPIGTWLPQNIDSVSSIGPFPSVGLRELGLSSIAEARTYFESFRPHPAPHSLSLIVPDRSDPIGSFFSSYGSGLTTLHFNYDLGGYFDVNLEQIDGIMECCPNLQTLNMYDDDRRRLLSIIAATSHPEVTVLELSTRQTQMRTRECRETFETLLKMKAACPKLKAIRFVGELQVTHFRLQHTRIFNPALAELRSQGVDFEDFQGKRVY